jgi:hypothetical protein
MTFLEAAIEILRTADAPLHFSEVARRAVDDNLLSHVGRDPEAAMRSCLTSAVRSGRAGEEPLIARSKPGYYEIRPGAKLPDPPPRPAKKKKSDSEVSETKTKTRASKKKTTKKKAAKKTTKTSSRRKAASAEDKPKTRRAKVAEAKEPEVDEGTEEQTAEASESDAAAAVEFEAPSGSGLDGVTDVALVMANAMSRLVEERPELKDELEAMQHSADEEEPATPAPRVVSRRSRETREIRDSRERENEDRGGRRRRRRRRRGKRVDWSGGDNGGESAVSAHEKLLDDVASVLQDAGSRSLHVRQIAETLAGKGVLGGEISEIERAVTSAILVDVAQRDRASRFVARGEARYQLQGMRLPEAAGKAEREVRDAARRLEIETRNQLIQWLQSLGARALESLVRVYLQREGTPLVAALPPARGVGKLVVDDPEAEDEGRTLVLVVPKRTSADLKLWESEAERNNCPQMWLFAMGDIGSDGGSSDARVIGPSEFAAWLEQHKIGVQTMTMSVPVLDATVIESIAGLDT